MKQLQRIASQELKKKPILKQELKANQTIDLSQEPFCHNQSVWLTKQQYLMSPSTFRASFSVWYTYRKRTVVFATGCYSSFHHIPNISLIPSPWNNVVTGTGWGSTSFSRVLDHEIKALSYGKHSLKLVCFESLQWLQPILCGLCISFIINLFHRLINGDCLRI